jgi:hypothetical protein
MYKTGVPLTRENYLHISYMGNPPEKLTAEEEASIPEMFRTKSKNLKLGTEGLA